MTPQERQLVAELFDRLARTQDSDEAAGIVSALDRLWLESGSDTSDLLMSRALQAMQPIRFCRFVHLQSVFRNQCRGIGDYRMCATRFVWRLLCIPWIALQGGPSHPFTS